MDASLALLIPVVFRASLSFWTIFLFSAFLASFFLRKNSSLLGLENNPAAMINANRLSFGISKMSLREI